MTKRDDDQGKDLDDWILYGPRDPEVFATVLRLAIEHGLKIKEIEMLILCALRQRLTQIEENEDPPWEP